MISGNLPGQLLGKKLVDALVPAFSSTHSAVASSEMTVHEILRNCFVKFFFFSAAYRYDHRSMFVSIILL